jgi:hypothetical protein
MLIYSRREIINIFKQEKKPLPKFVLESPKNAKFAMGFTLEGHVPLHKVGDKPQKVIKGILSIDPSYSGENQD